MLRPPRGATGYAGIGLRPVRGGLGARLRTILGKRADPARWEEVEEALIAADVGPSLSAELVEAVRSAVGPAATSDAVRAALGEEISARLERAAVKFELGPPPAVILFVGVNGTGKTTTLAKLAARLRAGGRRVALAAADTFRAAAIEQLRIWGDRLEVPVIAQRAGADPGAVAFDAVAAAQARQLDAVLIDSAGRLHNRTELMAELAKIRRVIGRRAEGQPRHTLLVIDATTGQNGLAQAEAFVREAGATGLILAKLDGTAKGGVVLAIVDRLGLPIHFLGIGEELDDLAPFDARAFSDWLLAG